MSRRFAALVVLLLLGVTLLLTVVVKRRPLSAPPSSAPQQERIELRPSPAASVAAPTAPSAARQKTRPRRPKPTPLAIRLPPSSLNTVALLSQADAALQAGQYDQALELFDRLLAIDPKNAAASEGRQQAASLRRRFVTESTVAENTMAVEDRMPGFESGSTPVKRPAGVPAVVEFEVAPARVKPGDPFSVGIFLRNSGKKDVRVRTLRLVTVVNGERDGRLLSPAEKKVNPQQSARIASFAGVWEPHVRTWALEVAVLSTRGDLYRSGLSWLEPHGP